MQLPVELEHFDVTMLSVSDTLTAVMEFKAAVMAVMSLDVLTVSRSDTWGEYTPWL